MDVPKYRIDKPYDWNYDNAPSPLELPLKTSGAKQGTGEFFGLAVESPLGIAAGPLLNGKWIRYYASLGFSVLTYKTVRSSYRPCYPAPNLTPVSCGQLDGSEPSVPVAKSMASSWAVSFGMPSKDPSIWRADIEETRRLLPSNKVLSVSVVGTMQEGWTIDELADDYAVVAKWAVDSGADCIETNFSCPNVSSCDGQLYQNPDAAAVIAERVRDAIGRTPFLIKIGHFKRDRADSTLARDFLQAIENHADGVVTTNSVALPVVEIKHEKLFDGQSRGICGDAIRQASIQQTAKLCSLIKENSFALRIVGVGGISSIEHVREYIRSGADAVQLATSAMLDPMVGIKIRDDL